MTRLTLLFVASALTFGCGKGGGEAAPAKPANGAPIAFEVSKVTPGADHSGAVEMRGYNFSDKTLATYWVNLRYSDAAGKPLKVKVGTPFESDADQWSFSGAHYKCDAKSWCDFKLDHLDVPAGAAKAEVTARSVTAVAADGKTMEEKPLFDDPNAK